MASVQGRPGDRLLGKALFGLLALLCLLPVAASAQDKPLSAFYRETWTTRQGLPHNQINAIAQTQDGYLWLGTWEGLVRYNGLEFQVFDRANTPELKDNGIRSVRASEDGAVVIGTSRGGVTVKRGDRWRRFASTQPWTVVSRASARGWARRAHSSCTHTSRASAMRVPT